MTADELATVEQMVRDWKSERLKSVQQADIL
jgi:hypothetical protein